MTMKQIAELIGVSSNQVYMWHQRRARNGFPPAAAQTIRPQYPGDKKRSNLFDANAVIDWYSTYDPLGRHGRHENVRRPQGPDGRWLPMTNGGE